MSATGTQYIGHLNSEPRDLIVRIDALLAHTTPHELEAFEICRVLRDAKAELERLRGFFLTVAALVDVDRMRR